VLADGRLRAGLGSDIVPDALRRPVSEVSLYRLSHWLVVSGLVSTTPHYTRPQTHFEQPGEERNEVRPFANTLKRLQTLVNLRSILLVSTVIGEQRVGSGLHVSFACEAL
jgi:hypothetical protein